MWYSPYYLEATGIFMATQTREKNTENGTLPTSYPSHDGGESGDFPTATSEALDGGHPHPLASVIGSFRDDLASLDAIMAGVEKYRQQMEAEEDPCE